MSALSVAVVVSAAAGLVAGGAGIAAAAGIGVTSADLSTGSAAVPVFYPSSLATAGKIVGLAQAGDTLTVVYSSAPDPSTLCSSWPAKTQRLSGTVTINDNAGAAGNDTLTVGTINGGKCGGAFTFGTVDLGSAGYVTGGSVSFDNSTIALTAAILTIIFGSPKGSGTTATVTAGNPAVYHPVAGITDASGVSAGANTASTSSGVQF